MKKLSRIVLFVVLKVVEISVIVFVPYRIGFWFDRLNGEFYANIFECWMLGICLPAICIGLILALFLFSFCLLPGFVKWNWSLVKRAIKD